MGGTLRRVCMGGSLLTLGFFPQGQLVTKDYPPYALAIIGLLVAASIMCIPLVALGTFIKHRLKQRATGPMAWELASQKPLPAVPVSLPLRTGGASRLLFEIRSPEALSLHLRESVEEEEGVKKKTPWGAPPASSPSSPSFPPPTPGGLYCAASWSPRRQGSQGQSWWQLLDSRKALSLGLTVSRIKFKQFFFSFWRDPKTLEGIHF